MKDRQTGLSIRFIKQWRADSDQQAQAVEDLLLYRILQWQREAFSWRMLVTQTDRDFLRTIHIRPD